MAKNRISCHGKRFFLYLRFCLTFAKHREFRTQLLDVIDSDACRTHLEDMLKNSRSLVLRRQERHGRRRIYPPNIKWSKWLYSGGEEEESMPANARKEHRHSVHNEQSSNVAKASLAESDNSLLSSKRAKDLENDAGLRAELGERPSSQNNLRSQELKEARKSRQGQPSLSLQLRGKMADIVEWTQNSDDLLYAFKLAFGVILVTWPAFVAKWNLWYSLNRGGAYQERSKLINEDLRHFSSLGCSATDLHY